MHYGRINLHDIANGEGVRVSLFVSGCRNHCKNCFNQETWDFNHGQAFTIQEEQTILKALEPSWINGLTVLGGEPLEEENQRALLPFLKQVKALYPEKSLWMYTGYLFDQDLINPKGKKHTEVTIELLGLVDILVDGRFVEEMKSLSIRFRGSTNQRIIDVGQSLKSGEVVLSKFN